MFPSSPQGDSQSIFRRSSSGVSEAEDGQEQGGVMADLAEGGGDSGIAREPDRIEMSFACQRTLSAHSTRTSVRFTATPGPGRLERSQCRRR